MIRRDLLVIGLVLSTSASSMIVACGSEAVGADLTSPGSSADAASSGGDGSAAGSSGSSGSSGASDGGARPADEAGVTANGGIDPPDAGPGGDTTTIACGATTCPIPAETCCVSDLKSGGNTSFVCVAGATCPTSGTVGDTAALKCSGTANCPGGTVCCVRVAGDNAASECKATCGADEAQLCDPKANVSGCSPAEPCSNDNIGDWGDLPKSFATCGGKEN